MNILEMPSGFLVSYSIKYYVFREKKKNLRLDALIEHRVQFTTRQMPHPKITAQHARCQVMMEAGLKDPPPCLRPQPALGLGCVE
jgi:hypothetical protein